ncbi:YqgE/AlgH family protein [Psychrobacter sp. FDAARGOS_221]|uniref:YqgE/AlgH family protein n=1 Tax=Psychrobacter sp. FDAARGOS_221 TaxID=1975705 RepID=UPI000BB551F3|nr:YqgE/AlgH family protein [Psychrobacter sp. FDAARGOS_221]PNK60596.1 YqgE/AlgH family protein [Psychrobacter sp. FDAARGOS_221]
MTLNNLTHHFLIAAPSMPDDRFAQSLIYICRHDKHGVLGLIVNKPILDTKVPSLLEGLDIEVEDDSVMEDVALEGGPVFPEVGFVLHTGQPTWASSFAISENVCITTSKDILHRIAEGQGVEHYYLCLGHASWTKGQLEREISQGDWLVCPADLSLLFEAPFEERWHLAANKIGVDFNFLSDDIGHA